jgi:hypothetical protein
MRVATRAGDGRQTEVASKALGNTELRWDDSFWQDGDDMQRLPSNEYVQGFVDGALNVWDQVADKI